MYRFHHTKAGRKYHEIDPRTGKSYCKMEHGSTWQKRPDEYAQTEIPPSDRVFCSICDQMRARKHPARMSKAESREFLQSWEWQQLRYKALAMRGAQCECCGASPKEGAVMMVDHIKPRATYPELALEISNLQILCASCNRGKGSWDETDWRVAQEPGDACKTLS